MNMQFNKPIRKSRDLIVKEAFKLFLQKNLEKVTVPELEQATNLQRGTIFYHFKDKDAIFKEVIEQYFFSPLNIFYPLEPDKICSLKEYWDKKNKHLSKIQYWFKQENIILNPYFAFFHLAEQGCLYIPTFKERMSNIINIDKEYWRLVARKDILVKNYKLDFIIISNILRGIYIEQYHTACYSEFQELENYPNLLEPLLNAIEKHKFLPLNDV